MNIKTYILDKLVTLCFLIIGALLFTLIYLLTSSSLEILILFLSAYLLVIALWLAFGYVNWKKKLNRLTSLASSLEEKYLIGEVLPKPTSALEKEYFYIMKQISESAINKVSAAERDKEDYCNYVQRWVHEIKTPLTACSLILDNGGETRKLKEQLKRADNLTENILYYARLKSISNDLKLKEFKISSAVERAIKNQQTLLIGADISIETRGDFSVVTDKKSLEFILMQLLINSSKYCPNCHINISAMDGVLIFQDDGVGIPSHEIDRVTERGFTGKASASDSSTGMGLYIVSELCDSLNIKMDVSSAEGKFTKFAFTFEAYENVM